MGGCMPAPAPAAAVAAACLCCAAVSRDDQVRGARPAGLPAAVLPLLLLLPPLLPPPPLPLLLWVGFCPGGQPLSDNARRLPQTLSRSLAPSPLRIGRARLIARWPALPALSALSANCCLQGESDPRGHRLVHWRGSDGV